MIAMSSSKGTSKHPARLESGVPRLDDILKGGLLKAGTYTIMGSPGTGKTLLANQICFNHIKRDGRCVYFTLLAETHAKMVRHLESLSYFDRDEVGKNLTYVSGYSELIKSGAKGLLDLMRKTLRREKPSLLVIDGLQAIHKCATNDREVDEFLNQLQAFTNLVECTTILLAPQGERGSHSPETILADGVLELRYELVGPRAVRELTVYKMRGSDFLPGRHEVEITSKGMQIHPRTEVQFDEPPEHGEENRLRMCFGIKRLDEMLGGGLLSGTTTTLLGSPGTGKTVLGLSFLVEGAKGGQKGIYFGFNEPPPRLIEKAERIGIPLAKYVKNGTLELLWQPPLEHYMDSLAERLLEKIGKDRPARSRLFIDGIEGFMSSAVHADRLPRFFSALTNQLRWLDVTSVITQELDLFKAGLDLSTPEAATIPEGVILLRYVELRSQIHRLISILKMRESEYDTSIREFKITNGGVVVAKSFESAERVLSGFPIAKRISVNGDGKGARA
jgi:circadian clock protein KaiC